MSGLSHTLNDLSSLILKHGCIMQQRKGLLAGGRENILVRGDLPENVQIPHGVARVQEFHARVLVLLRGGNPPEDLANLRAKPLRAALRIGHVTGR